MGDVEVGEVRVVASADSVDAVTPEWKCACPAGVVCTAHVVPPAATWPPELEVK